MLQVTEIYKSIQGEAAYSGFPCIFIRLTGCPLRCRWCDTVYGFKGGSSMGIDQILAKVKELDCPLVELTGGEPLAQEESINLMKALIEAGYKVLIETSGSESIKDVPKQVHVIMDIKCPGSGMDAKNNLDNLKFLKPTDEIKCVIASRADFDWAVELIGQQGLRSICGLLFSPAFGLVKPSDLVAWILESGHFFIKLNLQIHKYIWDPKKKGV